MISTANDIKIRLDNFLEQFQNDLLLMTENDKIRFCKMLQRAQKYFSSGKNKPVLIIYLVKINNRIKMIQYSDKYNHIIGGVNFNLNIDIQTFINQYTKSVQDKDNKNFLTFNEKAIPFILSKTDEMYKEYYQKILDNEEFNAYQNMMSGDLFLKDDDKKRLLNALKQEHYLPSNKQLIDLSLFKKEMSDDLYDILKEEFDRLYSFLNDTHLKETNRIYFLIAYSYFFKDIKDYIEKIEPFKKIFNQKQYLIIKDEYLNPRFSYSLELE